MFYIYWILMMISLITSFAYLSKALASKNRLLIATSLIQCLLSLLLPFMNLYYSIYSKNYADNPFKVLWDQINQQNLLAYLVLFGYLTIFTLVVYNGKKITDKKNEHSVTI